MDDVVAYINKQKTVIVKILETNVQFGNRAHRYNRPMSFYKHNCGYNFLKIPTNLIHY